MLLFRIVFHDVHDFSHTMEVQLQIFFNISFLCVQQKKLMQVWNNLRVSKWWQNSHIWVNYPFKNHWSMSLKQTNKSTSSNHWCKKWRLSIYRFELQKVIKMIAMNPALCLYQRKSTLNLDNLHLKITFLIDWQLYKGELFWWELDLFVIWQSNSRQPVVTIPEMLCEMYHTVGDITSNPMYIYIFVIY